MNIVNDRLIKALLRQEVDCTPVWLMRQAGRYLPEYRKVREQAGNFMALCQTPELACEVTLQPLRRFDLDAAILFSDILTIPDAMGLGLYFTEGEGPRFNKIIQDKCDIVNLNIPDPETELRYVCDAVRLIKKELNNKVPLIGFSGSPWTLATYMVEGGSSKTFSKIKSLLYNDPESLKLLLSKLAQAVSLYLEAQIKAGVNVVMIFDTWGGVLSTRCYEEFSLCYMKQIIDTLAHYKTPTLLFTKGGNLWLEKIAQTGCQGVGIDWTIDIGQAYHRVGDKVALQGNMDPAVLYAKPEVIVEEVDSILRNYGYHTGHIFNLGHGIHPDVPPENVKVFVDAVHQLSKKYHQSE